MIRIMEACGTHTQTISRYGLRSILDVEFVSGPGCPVCVCDIRDIDSAIELAKNKDIILTTFGDMYRVPGSRYSLSNYKNVRIVYDVYESLNIAKKTNKEVVHFSIGFETTIPSISYVIKNCTLKNFSIIPANLLFLKGFEYLLPKIDVDGFICPGHVSAITGSKPYEKLVRLVNKPMVICGFEPEDIIKGADTIKKQIKNGISKVETEYNDAVDREGNKIAQNLINEIFEPCDKIWRGIGKIKNSGLKLKKKFEKYDAIKKFDVSTENVKENKNCICGKIMSGKAKPKNCKLFKKICNPIHPIGPCMVSSEGACNIAFKYGEN
ncbi:MAG: hydrogenase formation protein HypD [Candidatus Aenigmarchaeota archaeon ex4484_56]|nr:MAG: hydrogenase formation protein HypD [Candidatus Aenigmarchaeota archaeon ex4484_56]